jgi:hypothetical protein
MRSIQKLARADGMEADPVRGNKKASRLFGCGGDSRDRKEVREFGEYLPRSWESKDGGVSRGERDHPNEEMESIRGSEDD